MSKFAIMMLADIAVVGVLIFLAWLAPEMPGELEPGPDIYFAEMTPEECAEAYRAWLHEREWRP